MVHATRLPCRLIGLQENLHQSECLRRVGTCEHAALQQREAIEAPLEAARETPLDQAARVCLLIHVGVAQGSSRMYLERPVSPLVSTARQVRVGCRRRGMSCPLTQSSLCVHHDHGGGCSTRISVDSGKYRGLVRLCGVMRWSAGLLYAPRGVSLDY